MIAANKHNSGHCRPWRNRVTKEQLNKDPQKELHVWAAGFRKIKSWSG